MATPNGRTPNVCAKCGAPLRMDNKKCIMGPLCDTVATSNYRSEFSTRPKISERRDAIAPPDAAPHERVTNPGFPAVSPDDKPLSDTPECLPACEECGMRLDRSRATCPRCGSSRRAPASPATASIKPAPSSIQEAYAAVKQGLNTPRAPQFDDVPVVTWVGPNGSSDNADAIDEYTLPVPGIPDSKAPGSR